MGNKTFMQYFNYAYGSPIGNKLNLLLASLIMVLVITAVGIFIFKAIPAVNKDSEGGLNEIIFIVTWSIFSLAITAGIISIWGF